jgi:hypothetical protein
VLLAEDLLVLTVDPAGGLVGDGRHAGSRDALARAMLIDLIVVGAIVLEQGRLKVVDPMPQSHRLLSLTLRVLGDASYTPDAAIARLRRRLWSVRSDLMDGFERLGIVHRLSSGLFGRFGRPHYALQSTQSHAERVAKLKRGCESPSLDDLYAVGLALLAEFVGLAEHFVASEARLRLRGWANAMKPSPSAISGGAGAPRQRLAAMLAVLA